MRFLKVIFFCVGTASALSPVVLTSDQEIVDGKLTSVDTRAMDQRRRLGASSANLLGAVAKATVSGDIAYSHNFDGPHSTSSGEDIVGPFEAGFSEMQDNIIEGNFGCSDPSKCYSDGGTDTKIAQASCAHLCEIDLPKCETASGDAVDCADADFATDVRFAFLDTCGGHTRQYHFHQFMDCLYDVTAAGHSTKIGEGEDAASTPLYGKYEATGEVPLLDACGAHFGITPDSDGASVYHHHVQENPPFTYGCYGPNDDDSLVSVETCRSLYDDCVEDDGSRRLQGPPPDSGGGGGGGDGESIDIETAAGTIRYTPWCPCYDGSGEGYDGAGLNTGVDIMPLAVFAESNDDDAESNDDTSDDCEDDAEWYWKKDKKDCDYMAKKKGKKCKKTGEGGMTGFDACPRSCGVCCADDPVWFVKKTPDKDCAWIAEKSKRCKEKGEDIWGNKKVKAKEACPLACDECP